MRCHTRHDIELTENLVGERPKIGESERQPGAGRRCPVPRPLDPSHTDIGGVDLIAKECQTHRPGADAAAAIEYRQRPAFHLRLNDPVENLGLLVDDRRFAVRGAAVPLVTTTTFLRYLGLPSLAMLPPLTARRSPA